MSLSLKERRVVVKEIPVRYKKVKKKGKERYSMSSLNSLDTTGVMPLIC
ncbi:MAG: hypothetical protein J7K51_04570 [Thermotogae bacterium]|nr:hypothetical protein [Thermotogota bacterium]